MPLDGHLGGLKTSPVQVVAPGHPAIILVGAIKRNAGLWEPGLILTHDANQELTPWDGSGQPAGVLIEDCDSSGQASAHYLAHGMAVIATLKKADGSAPTAAEIHTLAQAGIFGA